MCPEIKERSEKVYNRTPVREAYLTLESTLCSHCLISRPASRSLDMFCFEYVIYNSISGEKNSALLYPLVSQFVGMFDYMIYIHWVINISDLYCQTLSSLYGRVRQNFKLILGNLAFIPSVQTRRTIKLSISQPPAGNHHNS